MRIPPPVLRGRLVARMAGKLLLLTALPAAHPALAGTDWFPPPAAQMVAPNVTFQPGQPRTFSFVIRSNGVAASFRWTAVPSGTSGSTFTPQLSATTGTVSLAADQQTTVSITVTVPASAPNPSIGLITFKLAYSASGGMAAPNVLCMIRGATGGRPELYPSPMVLSTAAGAPASVVYNLHSTVGSGESYNLTFSTPSNPDSNNALNRFPYTLPASPVALPAGAAIPIPVPIHLPGFHFPGHLHR